MPLNLENNVQLAIPKVDSCEDMPFAWTIIPDTEPLWEGVLRNVIHMFPSHIKFDAQVFHEIALPNTSS